MPEEELSLAETIKRINLLRYFFGPDPALQQYTNRINTAVLKKATTLNYDKVIHQEVHCAIDELPESGHMDVFPWCRRLVLNIMFQAFLGVCPPPQLQDDFIAFEAAASQGIGLSALFSRRLVELLLGAAVDRKRARVLESLALVVHEALNRDPLEPCMRFAREHVDPVTQRSPSDKEIVLMVCGMLLGAVSNSATGVAQTILHVAENETVRALVTKEVRDIEEQTSREDLPAALKGSKVLVACALETARLNTSLQVGVRTVSNPEGIVLGKHHIPAGSFVQVSSIGLSFDDDTFQASGEFDPRRFLDPRNEDKGVSHPIVTWGGGHHACPGRLLAMNEMKLALAGVLARLEIKGVQGTKSLDYSVGTSILPRKGKSLLQYSKKIDSH